MLDQILFNQSPATNIDNIKFANAQQAKTISLMMTLWRSKHVGGTYVTNDYLLLTVRSVTTNNA